MADVREAARVDLGPGEEKVGATAHVHDLLDEVVELLRVQRRPVGDVARSRDGAVREERACVMCVSP